MQQCLYVNVAAKRSKVAISRVLHVSRRVDKDSSSSSSVMRVSSSIGNDSSLASSLVAIAVAGMLRLGASRLSADCYQYHQCRTAASVPAVKHECTREGMMLEFLDEVFGFCCCKTAVYVGVELCA